MTWHRQQKQSSHHLSVKRAAVWDAQAQIIGIACPPAEAACCSATKWGLGGEHITHQHWLLPWLFSSGAHGDIPRIATLGPDSQSVAQSRTLQYFHRGFPDEENTCQWGQVINSPRVQFFKIPDLASSSNPERKREWKHAWDESWAVNASGCLWGH